MSEICIAQSDFLDSLVLPESPIERTIERYTDSLLLNGFDTTISFFCQRCFGTGLYDQNSNVIEDAALIVAFSNKKLEIVKFVFGRIDSLEIYGIGKYQKNRIDNKDTLRLFESLTKPAEEEYLAPYVYKITNNENVGYYPLRSSHPEVDRINVKSRNHRRYLTVELNSLKEKWSDSPDALINLNYEFNTSLNLYSLHNLLISLSSRTFNLEPK